MTFKTIDLFAGAGGLTLGFALAGQSKAGPKFDTVFAIEHDSAAARTFKTNFGAHVYDGDIEFFDVAEYPEADVIVGGPPCQGFSPLGRDRDDESRAGLNGLWEHYLNAVLKVKPRAFVIENVPEFQKSAQFNELLHRMESDPFLRKFGFNYGVLNAADFGVPQRRRRGIFVAVQGTDVPWPPPPSHGESSPTDTPFATVSDAIRDLPKKPTTAQPEMKADGSQDLHIRRNPTAKSLERYKTIPPGGNRFDLMQGSKVIK